MSPANTSFYDYKLSPVVSIVRGAIPLSTQSTSGANNFESTLGGYTVSGQAHSLSAWFVLVLRLMMGWVFAWSGATMILGGFDAEGFSFATTANGSPLADLFVSMGNTPWFVSLVNVAVPWGDLIIGLELLVGAVTRLAAFFGAFMMLLFYFGNWNVAHGVINGDFAYMLVFLAVAAFGAGRILGADAWLENYEIEGTPLVERYPVLDFILG